MSGDRSPSHDCGVGYRSLTVMPMDRAVPAMIRSAMSRSFALRSAIFFSAISRTCARVTEPTLSLCGVPEPFATPDALISSCAAGSGRKMVDQVYPFDSLRCRFHGAEASGEDLGLRVQQGFKSPPVTSSADEASDVSFAVGYETLNESRAQEAV